MLYPIKEKNYEQNLYIKEAWDQACEFINLAERVTFFGYSAPKSDAAATERFLEAFKSSSNKEIKQVEIINIDDTRKLMQSYSNFIPQNVHIDFVKSYYESSLAICPRRSSDYLFYHLNNNSYFEGKALVPFLETDSLFDIAQKIIKIGDRIEPWYCSQSLSKKQIIRKLGTRLNGISRNTNFRYSGPIG